jgi:hypothetical protein
MKKNSVVKQSFWLAPRKNFNAALFPAAPAPDSTIMKAEIFKKNKG